MKKALTLITLLALFLFSSLNVSAAEGKNKVTSDRTYQIGEKVNVTFDYKQNTAVISGKGKTYDYWKNNYDATGKHKNPFPENTKSGMKVEVKKGVTTIGDYLFYHTNVASVSLPDTVLKIGEYAFAENRFLDKIVLSSRLRSIEKYAFSGCASLSNVTLPQRLQTIGERAFEGCRKFTAISIPGSVKKIVGTAFMNCKGLKSVQFGSGNTIIGFYAFYKCPVSFTAPAGTLVENYAEEYDIPFKSNGTIEVPPEGMPFDAKGLLYFVKKSDAKNGTVMVAGSENRSAVNIKIPDTVNINGYILKVTEVHRGTFYKLKNLRSVSIGRNVKVIGEKAFWECTSLKSITLPSKVQTIAKEAFYGCKRLKQISVKSSVLKSVGGSAFKGISSRAVIKVPSSKWKSYKKLMEGKGQARGVKITK